MYPSYGPLLVSAEIFNPFGRRRRRQTRSQRLVRGTVRGKGTVVLEEGQDFGAEGPPGPLSRQHDIEDPNFSRPFSSLRAAP